jgi:hypothetical protein
MLTQAFKEAQKRYRQSEKGKANLKRYHQTDKFREVLKRYRLSDKAKATRKAKPEVYMKSLNKMKHDEVCNILIEHAEDVKGDPERFTTEYICNMSGIIIEEEQPEYYIKES